MVVDNMVFDEGSFGEMSWHLFSFVIQDIGMNILFVFCLLFNSLQIVGVKLFSLFGKLHRFVDGNIFWCPRNGLAYRTVTRLTLTLFEHR